MSRDLPVSPCRPSQVYLLQLSMKIPLET